jgi:hypothetical protein
LFTAVYKIEPLNGAKNSAQTCGGFHSSDDSLCKNRRIKQLSGRVRRAERDLRTAENETSKKRENQEMKLTTEQKGADGAISETPDFGRKIGSAAAIFGSRHGKPSRSFSHKHASYRTCLKRGARKRFDPQTRQTCAAFYFSPVALLPD